MNGISVRRIKLPVLCEVVRLMGRLQKEVAMLRRKERLQKMKESSKSRRSPSFSQLPAAQREYFTYFQHASCNIVVVTLNGSILEANRCFCKSMKRSPDELIGSSLFSFIHPSSLPLLYKCVCAAFVMRRNICLLLENSSRTCSQFLCSFKREEQYEPHIVTLQSVSSADKGACFMVTLVALSESGDSVLYDSKE